jgi:hypothetical protein
MVRLQLSLSPCGLLVNAWLTGFEDGSPDGQDPLQLARIMASRGITLVCSDLVLSWRMY